MTKLLAAQFEEVVGIAIFAIIMIGSAVGHVLKKKEAEQKQHRGGSQEQRGALETLSKQRRAELIAEARRRRAEQLAQSPGRREQPSQAPPQRPDPTQQAAQREALRRRRAEADAERQRLRQIQRQRQQPQARPVPPMPPRPQEHAPRPVPPPRRPAPPPQPLAKPHYLTDHEQVHRLVRDAKPTPAVVHPMRARISLRQAIIWKEILDKPLALRSQSYDFPT